MVCLEQTQASFEEDAIGIGITRYREAVQKAEKRGTASDLGVSNTLARGVVPRLAEAIKVWVEGAYAGRAGRRHAAAAYLLEHDPEVVALLTTRTVLDTLTQEQPLQRIAVAIATRLEDELRWRLMQQQAPGYWYKVNERLRKQTRNYKHARQVLMNAAKNLEQPLEMEPWPERDKLLIGQRLIELLIESTGIVELRLAPPPAGQRKSLKASYILTPAAETLEWLQDRHARAEVLSPYFQPMVVPPKDWTTPRDGGYRHALAGKLTLIKTRNRNYLEELAAWEMPVVYEAVNRLQQTPWQINRAVLEVMAQVADQRLPFGNLPTGEYLELPPKPGPEASEEEIVSYRHKAREVYERNTATGTKVVQLAKVLSTAETFVDFERIYFPYQLDFRGRAYPVPIFLHPQGPDHVKGLLRFADGKPLGEDGAAWLAIHLANCYGVDKLPLQERIRWVEANQDHIVQSAMDPLGYRWWADAEAPWQTLAACFEWAGYLLIGNGYVSHLPVAMDGSCNGLQHYSAMLRDPVGGAAVNLVPRETPADIYREVLEKVLRKLEQEAQGEGEDALLAQTWLVSGLVDRDMCKRPVMTMPYGSKQFGIRGQIMQELNKRVRNGETTGFGEGDGWPEAGLLARLIWDAIGETVVAARVAMDWLQEAAGLAAREGLPIHWVAPNGLPVLQEYKELEAQRIASVFQGQRIRITLSRETAKLDRPASATASPRTSSTHSMPAP